jgi:glucosamine-6-phosphate deaminase
MLDRKKELQNLLTLSPEEVREKAGNHLIVCKTLEDLHKKFAENIISEIRKNNHNGKDTVLILPVGPTGQYPILADRINTENISLENCWLFFMDEYCNEEGKAVSRVHPLSFQKIANKLFLNKLNQDINLNPNQIFFPNEQNIGQLAGIIKKKGGIDTCYGGIGIHGHLAFNEPAENISTSGPRKVQLNNFTIIINAIRAHVGGNLEGFPKEAYTLGMKQILGANRIRLYCRNGSPYDWANSVLRLALFGEPGDDYPVTHIRDHPDYIITTDLDTLSSPEHII